MSARVETEPKGLSAPAKDDVNTRGRLELKVSLDSGLKNNLGLEKRQDLPESKSDSAPPLFSLRPLTKRKLSGSFSHPADLAHIKRIADLKEDLKRLKGSGKGSNISDALWLSNERVNKCILALLTQLNNKSEKGEAINLNDFVFIKANLGDPTNPAPANFFNEIDRLNSVMRKKIRPNSYGPAQGTKKARTDFAKGFTKRYSFPVDYKEISITLGGLNALKLCFTTAKEICKKRGKGEPVFCAVVPIYPGYISDMDRLPNQIHGIDVMKLAGYRLTAEALRKGLRETLIKAKMQGKFPHVYFIFNNPHNPTGISYTEKELREFSEVFREEEFKDINIIQDSAYIAQGGQALENVAPDLYEAGRLINCESLTKSHSLAEHRVGVVVTKNADFATWIPTLMHSSGVIHHSPLIQRASARAFRKTTPEYLESMRTGYFKKRSFIFNNLKQLGLAPQDKTYDPSVELNGAYYVLADIKRFYGSPMVKEDGTYDKDRFIQRDQDFFEACLIKTKLAVSPLSFFGTMDNKVDEGLVRLSCTEEPEKWAIAFERLKNWLNEIEVVKQPKQSLTASKEPIPTAQPAAGELKNDQDNFADKIKQLFSHLGGLLGHAVGSPATPTGSPEATPIATGASDATATPIATKALRVAEAYSVLHGVEGASVTITLPGLPGAALGSPGVTKGASVPLPVTVLTFSLAQTKTSRSPTPLSLLPAAPSHNDPALTLLQPASKVDCSIT